MSSKLVRILMGYLVSVTCTFAASPSPHETESQIYLVLQEKDRPIREVVVDKKTVEQVAATTTELAPYLALSVLTVSGVDCCPPITKLSDTVWRCCDGNKKIVTTSAALNKVLARVNQVSPSQWEKFKREKHIMAFDPKMLDELLERKPEA